MRRESGWHMFQNEVENKREGNLCEGPREHLPNTVQSAVAIKHCNAYELT